MSTIRKPVGPQSAKVYWRRRAVVLLGLLAVIVVVLLIVFRPGSGEAAPVRSAPPADTTQTDGPPASDEPATGDDDETDAPAEGATEPEAATIPTEPVESEGVDCKSANVLVEAATDQSDYAAGEQPKLTLSIENTGSKPCVINAGTAKQVFTITSGKEVYWVSTDCQSKPVDTDVTLEPGKVVSSSVPIVWDRTRSSASTCGNQREAVPAGGASYWLNVSVDGIESAQGAQFLLY